jgi:hypothetical protein
MYIFLVALMDSTWSQVFIALVFSHIGCPVIEVGVFPHLRTETDPVSETLCFSLLFRENPDDGQNPKTQYLWILVPTVCLNVSIFSLIQYMSLSLFPSVTNSSSDPPLVDKLRYARLCGNSFLRLFTIEHQNKLSVTSILKKNSTR